MRKIGARNEVSESSASLGGESPTPCLSAATVNTTFSVSPLHLSILCHYLTSFHL